MRRLGRDLIVVVVAAGIVGAGGRVARQSPVRPVETKVFTALNGLDARAFVPAWTVMQVGSLGGALASGAAVAVAGQPRLGRRMAVAGTVAWTASKCVKPFVGRGRPAVEVGSARVLGREQLGLGYPSGHAAVAAALAAVVAPHVTRPVRSLLSLGVLGIGATRLYVGAHLPLDVVGGVALGVGTERLMSRAQQLTDRAPRRDRGAEPGGAADGSGRRRLVATG